MFNGNNGVFNIVCFVFDINSSVFVWLPEVGTKRRMMC